MAWAFYIRLLARKEVNASSEVYLKRNPVYLFSIPVLRTIG